MAIIKSLSFTTGGGVLSSATQSKQKKDVVSIFIGLGGTGTDAIRAIKTQVNERLIPDNAKEYADPDSNVSIREYRHIKFLSIDTDKRASSSGGLGFGALEETELFPMEKTGVIKKIIADKRPDLKWLDLESVNQTKVLDIVQKGHGAGACRQAGRYLLFEKIDLLQARLKELIDDASVGMPKGYKVVVHIFAGISGGTGSGTFLDVCYLVRKVLDKTPSSILGYFFMPDVNLSIDEIDPATKELIPRNGYAALQELNYCMGIPENGGKFSQVIKGNNNSIDWKCPPVDMCHLIGAKTEALVDITGDAYNYAMHTVAEYVMDYFSENENVKFDVYSISSNQAERILEQVMPQRTGGHNPCMVSLGAACVSIPFREMNTYLVSGVFEYYRETHRENVTQAEANTIIKAAWNAQDNQEAKELVEMIYASILKKLTGDEYSGLQTYDYYPDPDGMGKPWKHLLQDVVPGPNRENELEAHYKVSLNNHFGLLQANADKLMQQGNGVSLIDLLEKQLDAIVRDANRGPQYAKNVINGVEGVNVLNLIEGLKRLNDQNALDQEMRRTDSWKALEESRRIFFDRESQGWFDNDEKRYTDFENSAIDYVQLLELIGGVYKDDPEAREITGVYGYIKEILDTLEKQIKERLTSYYSSLSDVLSDLTDTFKANKVALEALCASDQQDGFEKPLFSIKDKEIKEYLDSKIADTHKEVAFARLMGALIKAGPDLVSNKETRLPKIIQSIFVEPKKDAEHESGIFADVVGMTIDEYLEQKYNEKGQTLENLVKADFLNGMTDNSSPLLALDDAKTDDVKLYRVKISYPDTSSVIGNALNGGGIALPDDAACSIIPSPIHDRILFAQIRDGFPLQAYIWCEDAELTSFASSHVSGCHLYEADGIYENNPFSDWKILPTATAPTFMRDGISSVVKNKVDSIKELFDKAVDLGIIKINSPYQMNNESDYSYLYGIDESIQEEIDGLAHAVDSVGKSSELQAIKARVAELLDGGHSALSRTEIKLKPYAGKADYDESIKLDYLYYSPVYQNKVREITSKMTENLKVLKDVEAQIKQKEEAFSREEAKCKKNFFLAIHTGILQIPERGKIVYEHDDNGLIKSYVLSSYDPEDGDFKYSDIPYYQAYLSYQELDPFIKDSINSLASKKRASDATQQYARELKDTKLGDDEINNLRKMLRNNGEYEAADIETIERFLVDLKNFIF